MVGKTLVPTTIALPQETSVRIIEALPAREV